MAKSKTNQSHSVQPTLTLASTASSNKLKIRLDDMKTIDPLTENQKHFFDAYDESDIMLLHGVAGTGKTFIAL